MNKLSKAFKAGFKDGTKEMQKESDVLGSSLGTLAGLGVGTMMAPATGGLSLAVPAATSIAGGFAGDMTTDALTAMAPDNNSNNSISGIGDVGGYNTKMGSAQSSPTAEGDIRKSIKNMLDQKPNEEGLVDVKESTKNEFKSDLNSLLNSTEPSDKGTIG